MLPAQVPVSSHKTAPRKSLPSEELYREKVSPGAFTSVSGKGGRGGVKMPGADIVPGLFSELDW